MRKCNVSSVFLCGVSQRCLYHFSADSLSGTKEEKEETFGRLGGFLYEYIGFLLIIYQLVKKPQS